MRRLTLGLLMGLLTVWAAPIWAADDPCSWDILNEQYGSGSGQVSFNNSYVYLWSVPAAETLSDGYATITLDMGSGYHHATKSSIAGMPTDGSEVTTEVKMRTADATQVNLFLSETNNKDASHWNHIFTINGLFQGYDPNVLGDYNLRTASHDIAPANFDSHQIQTYRFVYQDGITYIYLNIDGIWTSLGTLENGTGAAHDGVNFEVSFVQSASKAAAVDMYHVKIANGAYPDINNHFDPCEPILEEYYGNGATNPEEVSFNAQYTYPWTASCAETLYDGYASLAIPMGSNYFGPVKSSIVGLAREGADVTVEFKCQAVNGSGINVFLSETNVGSTSTWDHIFQINRMFGTAQIDALADYNLRDYVVNWAPAGFDGTAVHTYRMTYEAEKGYSYMWLYDDPCAPVRLGVLTDGTGASIDGKNFEWSFTQDPTQDATVNMYHLLILAKAEPKAYAICGDPGTYYLPSDLSLDCKVDLADFALFSADWLKCTDPQDVDCAQYIPQE